MTRITHFLSIAALLLPLCAHAADQGSPAEQKLRDALRNTALQMRTLQGERDTLQAAKDQLEAEKKEISDKLEALTKESTAAEAAATKTIAETTAKLTAAQTQNEQLNAAIERWKLANKQLSDTSDKREAARAKLYSEKVVLDRIVADQRRKNQEMHKVGTEILSRYEGFGLGTAIAAREPFVGTMKVKLENLVQDYSDKLADQRIKP